MSTDKLRIEASERVDIQDFRFLAKDAIDTNQRQLLTQFMNDPAKVRKWVVGGFEMTNPAAKQLQVTRGKAIAAFRESGTIYYGLLLTEGDTTKIVDLNTYGAGTYGIYVRFEYVEGDSESRIFWNPAGAGSEYTQTIPTRYLANWSIRVESSNPGDEWMKIGEVAQATMTITDQRPFYFEGVVSGTYESGWSSDGGGVANDRNADRAQYGTTDLQTFTGSMRQCLEDIKGRGLRRWWERDIGGMNLGFDAAPVEDRLAIGDAAHYLEKVGGVVTWQMDAKNEINYTSDEITIKIGNTDQLKIAANSFASLVANHDLGSAAFGWRNLYFESAGQIIYDTGDYSTYDTGTNEYRWYIGTALEFTVNATGSRLYGNLTIDDILYLSTSAAEGVGSSVVPIADDTYDVGNSSYRWKDIYSRSHYLSSVGANKGILHMRHHLGGADEKVWGMYTDALGQFNILCFEDDYDLGSTAIKFERSGTTPSKVDFLVGSVDITDAATATLILHDSGGTATYKKSAFYQTGDALAIASAADNGTLGSRYLQFTRDGSGDLDELLIGNAGGTDTPVVRGTANNIVALGTSSYRFTDSYATKWDIYNLNLEYNASYGGPYIQLVKEHATDDAGRWRIYGFDTGFSIYSYRESDTGFYTIPMEFELDTGAGADAYIVENIKFTLLDHVILDGHGASDVGIAIKQGDCGGLAGNIVYTGQTAAIAGANVRPVHGGNTNVNAGYLKIYDGTSARYIPYWIGN